MSLPLKGSGIVGQGIMSDAVNVQRAAAFLENVALFKVWRCANDGYLPLRSRTCRLELYWYRWIKRSGPCSLSPDLLEAFRNSVLPNGIETPDDLLHRIAVFAHWRIGNQGLLPVRASSDLEMKWCMWIERMSCRIAASYQEQAQLTIAVAEAFSYAVRSNSLGVSLLRVWIIPDHAETFSEYTKLLCKPLVSYFESGVLQSPQPFGTDSEAALAYRNYQLLFNASSPAYKNMPVVEKAYVRSLIDAFPGQGIPEIKVAVLKACESLLLFIKDFPNTFPSYAGDTRNQAVYRKRQVLMNPTHAIRRDWNSFDADYVEALLLRFVPICKDTAQLREIIQFISSEGRLPTNISPSGISQTPLERRVYSNYCSWLRAFRSGQAMSSGIATLVNDMINMMGSYSGVKQKAANMEKKLLMKVKQAEVDQARQSELAAFYFVDRVHYDGTVLSGGRYASSLSSRELNQCVRAAGSVSHHCVLLSGQFPLPVAQYGHESFLCQLVDGMQDAIGISSRRSDAGKFEHCSVRSFSLISESGCTPGCHLSVLVRFRRSSDKAQFLQLIAGSESVTFWRLVQSKAADIHLQQQRHRQYCSSTLLSAKIVSRIQGKTSRCPLPVAQCSLASPIELILTDEFIEQDPEPLAVEGTKPDALPLEADDLHGASPDACPEVSVVTVDAAIVNSCSSKKMAPPSFSSLDACPEGHAETGQSCNNQLVVGPGRVSTYGLNISFPHFLEPKPKKCGTWAWFKHCAHCESQIRMDANNGMMTNDVDIMVFSLADKVFSCWHRERPIPRHRLALDSCRVCERMNCSARGVISHQHARILCQAATCQHCARAICQVNDRDPNAAMPWHMPWTDLLQDGTYEQAAAKGLLLCRRCFSTQVSGLAIGTLIKDKLRQQTLKRCVKCCRASFCLEYAHEVSYEKDPFPLRTDREGEDIEVLPRSCCDECVQFLTSDCLDQEVLKSRFQPLRRKVQWVLCKHCNFQPHLWTAANLMDPGPQHLVFQHLSHLGHLLIARIHPSFSIFPLQSGWLGYSGSVYCVGLRLGEWASTLPWRCSKLPVILITPRNRKPVSINLDPSSDPSLSSEIDALVDGDLPDPQVACNASSKRSKISGKGPSKASVTRGSVPAAQGNAALRVNKKVLQYCLQFLFSKHKFMKDSVTFDAIAMECLPDDGVPDGLHYKEEADGEDEVHAWLFKQIEFESWWDSHGIPLSIPHLLIRDSLRSFWSTHVSENTTRTSRFHKITHYLSGKQCWEHLLEVAEEEHQGAEANAREGQSSAPSLNCAVLFQILKPHQLVMACRAQLDDIDRFVSELRSEIMSCQIEHVLKADLLLGDLDTSCRVTREREELVSRGVPESWVSMPEYQDEPIKD